MTRCKQQRRELLKHSLQSFSVAFIPSSFVFFLCLINWWITSSSFRLRFHFIFCHSVEQSATGLCLWVFGKKNCYFFFCFSFLFSSSQITKRPWQRKWKTCSHPYWLLLFSILIFAVFVYCKFVFIYFVQYVHKIKSNNLLLDLFWFHLIFIIIKRCSEDVTAWVVLIAYTTYHLLA